MYVVRITIGQTTRRYIADTRKDAVTVMVRQWVACPCYQVPPTRWRDIYTHRRAFPDMRQTYAVSDLTRKFKASWGPATGAYEVEGKLRKVIKLEGDT